MAQINENDDILKAKFKQIEELTQKENELKKDIQNKIEELKKLNRFKQSIINNEINLKPKKQFTNNKLFSNMILEKFKKQQEKQEKIIENETRANVREPEIQIYSDNSKDEVKDTDTTIELEKTRKYSE